MSIFKPLYTSLVVEILKDFNGFLVGGCVRDALLGKQSKDIDICCPYNPTELEGMMKESTYKWRKHGKNYGVFVITDDGGKEVELSSMRQDLNCDGRHCTPSFTKEIEFDCGRRDLTINSLALNLEERLFDFHGGKRDLHNKIVRFVGNAKDRIDEDNLRSWRALRFAYTLDFDMDVSTLVGIASYVNSFFQVHVLDEYGVVTENLTTFCGRKNYTLSGERIQKELNSILLNFTNSQDNYMYLSALLQTTGLPILQCWNHLQPKEFHNYSISEHTLKVMSFVQPDLELRMAAMLHDIGKPKSARLKPNGEFTFPKHEVESAVITKSFLKNLKYPGEFVDNVTNLVAEHMKVLPKSNSKKLQFYKSLGDKLYKKHVMLRIADLCGKGSIKAFDSINRTISDAFEILNLEEQQPLQIALDGKDVMQEFNCGPGPFVGKALTFAKELVQEDPSNNDKELLLKRVRQEFVINIS